MAGISRRAALAGLVTSGALAACGGPSGGRAAAEEGSLEWAPEGAWRIDPQRDSARHPAETLRFFGLEGDMTVVDVLPGLGWTTSFLAPYLAYHGGRYIAAGFDPRSPSISERETLAAFEARFADQRLYGAVERAVLSATSPPLPIAGEADLIVMANVVHLLMAQGFAEKAFADLFAAARAGGVLGVEQHRASATGVQDPLARNGYVQEAYVKALAEEAGFVFVGASDVNANPEDDREHPFGVWTLPPSLRTAPLGQPPDPRFDTAPYRAVGESDRMTLRFRKGP